MTSKLVEDSAAGAESTWLPSSRSSSCPLARKSVLACMGIGGRMPDYEVVCNEPSSNTYNFPRHRHAASRNFRGTGHMIVVNTAAQY